MSQSPDLNSNDPNANDKNAIGKNANRSKKNPDLPPELFHLMSAWADDALTDDEFDQLDEILKGHREARLAFSRYVRICQSLPDLVVPGFELRDDGARTQLVPMANDPISSDPFAKFPGRFNTARSSDVLTHQKVDSRVTRSTSTAWPQSTQSRSILAGLFVFLCLAGGVYWRSGNSDTSALSSNVASDQTSAQPDTLSNQSGTHHSLDTIPNVAGLIAGGLNTQGGLSSDGSAARVVGGSARPFAGTVKTHDFDSHLAVVTQSNQVVWDSGSATPHIGSAVSADILRLTSGVLELEFATGASLRIRGPAEFALISKSRGKLTFGELAAHVPDQAHGFTIDTPSVEVVDLGTEFAINVERNGVADVHVFRGLVETRMPSHEDAPGSLERLTADQTRRFASGQSKSQLLSFDQSRYPTPPQRYLDEPTTEGAICLLREAPTSLQVGALESNEFILLLEERKNVLAPRALPVNLSLPGRYDQFRGKGNKLRQKIRVDSYLMHFDALTTSLKLSHLRLDGSVTFPRPIVGVIAAGPLLASSDSVFGNTEVLQSEGRSRGLDRGAKGGHPDVVTLSEDRRTLHVSFSVGGSCDQLRILIEAEQGP